jgi:amino acid transporter
MRIWRNLLGAFVLWALHFIAVYGIASALPGTGAAVILVLLVTGIAIAIASWFFAKAYADRSASDDVERWSARVALLGYALAGAAIIYQGLPAILS